MILPEYFIETEPGCKNENVLVNSLTRMIGCRFSVASYHSAKYYEDFTMPDGEKLRLLHYVFGYATPGRITDADKCKVLIDKLWETIKGAWPPGTFLMWRRFPELTEVNNKDPGWIERGDKEANPDAPDNWIVKITLRIGAFVKPLTGVVVEGDPIPLIQFQ